MDSATGVAIGWPIAMTISAATSISIGLSEIFPNAETGLRIGLGIAGAALFSALVVHFKKVHTRRDTPAANGQW